ncbi:hypothetical protein HDU96_007836 [Phlyctochytrium bullatum]|nr:hypothetical protein HDU96_007836 [Phlyctochytrium bullatum]
MPDDDSDWPTLPAQSRSNHRTTITPVALTKRWKPSGGAWGEEPRACFVYLLPDEILIQALANLDPYHLRLAATVCKKWHTVIADDGIWRTALECSLQGLPARRIARNSWRMEYLRRSHLQREWEKTFGKRVVQFDPRVGRIGCTAVEVDGEAMRMVVGSAERGMAVVCHPQTGKVEKSAVRFGGDGPMELADLVFDRSRLFAGLLNGGIHVATNVLSRSAPFTVRAFSGFHDGPVSKLFCPAGNHNAIVSGGYDGTMRVWNVATGTTIAVGDVNTSTITALAADIRQFIAAGTQNGSISVWSVDPMTLKRLAVPANLHSNATSPALNPVISPTPVVLPQKLTFSHFKTPTANRPVTAMQLDTVLGVLVTLCECPANEVSNAVRLWNVGGGCETGVRLGCGLDGVPTGKGSAVTHIGRITAMQWDRPVLGPTERKTSILATGDEHGRICLWELFDAALLAVNPTQHAPRLTPLRVLQAHPSPVSTLQMDPFKLVSGSAAGSVRVFDITTGRVLQSLSLRRGNEVGDPTNGDGRSIGHLWMGEWSLTAAAGGTVRCWDFKANSGNSAGAGPGRARRRAMRTRTEAAARLGVASPGGRGSPAHSGGGSGSSLASRIASPKAQLNLDLRHELRDYEDFEHHRRKMEQRREREWARSHGRAQGSLEGMSEDELVNYALMLSMEQSPATAAATTFTPMDEAEAIALAESLSLAEHQQRQASSPLSPLASVPGRASESLPNLTLPPPVDVRPAVALLGSGSSASSSARSSFASIASAMSSPQKPLATKSSNQSLNGSVGTGLHQQQPWYLSDWDYDRDVDDDWDGFPPL